MIKNSDEPPPEYHHLSNFLKEQIVNHKKIALSRHSNNNLDSINTSITKKTKCNNAIIEKMSQEIQDLKRQTPNRKSATQIEKLKNLQNAFLQGVTSPTMSNGMTKPSSFR